MDYLLAKRLVQFQQAVENTEVSVESDKLSLESGITRFYILLEKIRDKKRAIYVIGNGGSASVASHAVVDFMNVAKLRAYTLHDTATLTCMANDYGYENAFSNIISNTTKEKDLLIAISSSGKSKNIINAVEAARQNGAIVVTLSGFDSKNSLRIMGDINFWCNSKDYGMVEIAHQFILHNLADRFSNDINNQ